jgi:methyl-accepting chemotaxis protein
MAVSAMAVLLIASMIVMLFYSRKNIKDEALQEAMQTLDATVQNIDNILLSVEQATGNVYFSMIPHLADPQATRSFSRKLVESSPYITDCNITYGKCDFTEQQWFIKPAKVGKEPLICFCLPFVDNDGKPMGEIRVDVSLGLLSRIVAEAKPSQNSSCILLDSLGEFIVHPDADNLMNQSAIEISRSSGDSSIGECVKAMISGQTGYMPFRIYGEDFYVFYKPFTRGDFRGRVAAKLGWSAGIIYPADDIFGDYNNLIYYVLAITIVGLLLMYLLSYAIIRSRLKPLVMLTEKAQYIAEGNFNETIPDSRHIDEVGRLQDNFQLMQKSLANHIGELEKLKNTLHERGEGLREAYDQAKKADRMKTSFLHNMTNQMMVPAEAIEKDVDLLCSKSECNPTKVVADIQQNGKAITELLKNLITMSDDEMRKEAADD